MIIGVPKEIKAGERRVSMTPQGVDALVAHHHRVLVEKGAGEGSGFSDREYLKAGAILVDQKKEAWAEAEMVVKVKEPLEPEFTLMKPGQVLFTYLHLAADRDLTLRLVERRIVGIGYETVQERDGSLPLLRPMSEIAGRSSIFAGGMCLEARHGGKGILLCGASGVPPAKVVILGAGVAGANACKVALGIGARVSILDIRPERLSYLHDITQGHITTFISNRMTIAEEIRDADLVIGSVLIPGAHAPKLVTRPMLKRMRPGSAIVDISVDQGGCFETTRPTTHEDPTYIEEGVVHYCVANIPGAYPRTSTLALTNATFPYVLQIADKGYQKALEENEALRRGLNLIDGNVVYQGVAETFGLVWRQNPFSPRP
ncbi:MAG: alanine dehydrogenase [Deltaproteobacteria bacterium RBG_13_53_10]|nr:MAG: alanine dehydrogenase [Deltaproteobacteria bacterium RBG_13_53_10]